MSPPEHSDHRKRLRRHERPGHARFLTFSTQRRLPLFDDDAIKSIFALRLARLRDAQPFDLFAWVVMPEHIHLVIRPDPSHAGGVEPLLHRLKNSVAKRALAHLRRTNNPILTSLTTLQNTTRFWLPGGGYDRNIFTTHELLEKINYIHNNPVARRLVARPADWLWSSARWYDGDRSGPVTIDPLPRH